MRLFRDSGAAPFVKTTVPITLLSFETQSAIFGATKNPHVRTHSPEESNGGKAALLALGGSRIGLGTDIADSYQIVHGVVLQVVVWVGQDLRLMQHLVAECLRCGW